MTQEDVIDELKYMLKRLPKEPPQDCDYTDEWYQTNCKMAETYNLAIKWLQSKPSVTPTRKKGHWIMTGDYYTGAYGSIDYVKCSCCGEDSLEEGDYCPNCGAEMESE